MKTVASVLFFAATSSLAAMPGQQETPSGEVEYQTRRLFRAKPDGGMRLPPEWEQVSCGRERTIRVVNVAKELAKKERILGWRRIGVRRVTPPAADAPAGTPPRSQTLLGGTLLLNPNSAPGMPIAAPREAQPENKEGEYDVLPCYPTTGTLPPAEATYMYWVRNEKDEYDERATCTARLAARELLTLPEWQPHEWAEKENMLRPYLHDLNADPDLAGILSEADDGTVDCYKYYSTYTPVNLVDLRRGAHVEQLHHLEPLIDLFLSYGGKRIPNYRGGAAAGATSSSSAGGREVGPHQPFVPFDVTPVRSLLDHMRAHLDAHGDGLRYRLDQLSQHWRHPQELHWSEKAARDMMFDFGAKQVDRLEQAKEQSVAKFQRRMAVAEEEKQAEKEAKRRAYLAAELAKVEEFKSEGIAASDSDANGTREELPRTPTAPVKGRRSSTGGRTSSYQDDLAAAAAGEDEEEDEDRIRRRMGRTSKSLASCLEQGAGTEACEVADEQPLTPMQTPRRGGDHGRPSTPLGPRHPDAPTRREDFEREMERKLEVEIQRNLDGRDSDDDEDMMLEGGELAWPERSTARSRFVLLDDDSEGVADEERDTSSAEAEHADAEEDAEVDALTERFHELKTPSESGSGTPTLAAPPVALNQREHANLLSRRLTEKAMTRVQVGGASSSSGPVNALVAADVEMNDPSPATPPGPAPMTPVARRTTGGSVHTPLRQPRRSDPGTPVRRGGNLHHDQQPAHMDEEEPHLDMSSPVTRASRKFGVTLRRTGMLQLDQQEVAVAGTPQQTTPARPGSEQMEGTPMRTPSKRDRPSAGFVSRSNSDREDAATPSEQGRTHTTPGKLKRRSVTGAAHSTSDGEERAAAAERPAWYKLVSVRSPRRQSDMQDRIQREAARQARRAARKAARKLQQEREIIEMRQRFEEELRQFDAEPTEKQKELRFRHEDAMMRIAADAEAWKYQMRVSVGDKSLPDNEEMLKHFQEHYLLYRREKVIFPALQKVLHVKRMDKVVQNVLKAYQKVSLSAPEMLPLLQMRAEVLRDIMKRIAAFTQLNIPDIAILYGGVNEIPPDVRALLS